MSRLWLFLHLLGVTMWLGGGFGAMLAGIASKREGRDTLGGIVRAQAAIHGWIIGPGAVLTVLSGLILTFHIMGDAYAGANTWLIVMQAGGILAALLTLFISVPTMARLGRLDPAGEGAAYFDELRARHRIVASIAGTIGLVALFAGAALRYGG